MTIDMFEAAFVRGTLNDGQAAAVAAAINRRQVADIGTYAGRLAERLLELGASGVDCISDDELPLLPPNHRIAYTRVRDYETVFSTGLIGQPQLLFMNWPVDKNDWGLLDIVQQATLVIYLGSNIGGNACGSHELFRHFIRRELLVYEPGRHNSLLVYGASTGKARRPVGEEWGALSRRFDIEPIHFEQMEEAAATADGQLLSRL